jgi:hypothetical protein
MNLKIVINRITIISESQVRISVHDIKYIILYRIQVYMCLLNTYIMILLR